VRRFLNGILVASLIGGMVGLIVNGRLKPQRKNLMGKTKRISSRASKIMGEVTKDVSKFMNKK